MRNVIRPGVSVAEALQTPTHTPTGNSSTNCTSCAELRELVKALTNQVANLTAQIASLTAKKTKTFDLQLSQKKAGSKLESSKLPTPKISVSVSSGSADLKTSQMSYASREQKTIIATFGAAVPKGKSIDF